MHLGLVTHVIYLLAKICRDDIVIERRVAECYHLINVSELIQEVKNMATHLNLTDLIQGISGDKNTIPGIVKSDTAGGMAGQMEDL